jgi:hypothetical protein
MEYYYENYVDQMTPKQKMGWRMLYLLAIKKYPFIREIKIDKPLDLYSSIFVVSLVVDIEKIVEQYNVEQAERRPMSTSSPYLFPFFKEDEMFSWNFNDILEEYLNECYSIVPDNMAIKKDYPEFSYTKTKDNMKLHLSRFEPYYND